MKSGNIGKTEYSTELLLSGFGGEGSREQGTLCCATGATRTSRVWSLDRLDALSAVSPIFCGMLVL